MPRNATQRKRMPYGPADRVSADFANIAACIGLAFVVLLFVAFAGVAAAGPAAAGEEHQVSEKLQFDFATCRRPFVAFPGIVASDPDAAADFCVRLSEALQDDPPASAQSAPAEEEPKWSFS
jgi:hypothetical protein